jgi:hypothetical protein
MVEMKCYRMTKDNSDSIKVITQPTATNNSYANAGVLSKFVVWVSKQRHMHKRWQQALQTQLTNRWERYYF